MLEIKRESVEDVNFTIETLYRIYENLTEDSYGLELTTVADEVTRLGIALGDIATPHDLEILKQCNPKLLMLSRISSSPTSDGNRVYYYDPLIGFRLIYELTCSINEIADEIRHNRELLEE